MSGFDLAVIGGGPGGYSAALRAAYHGKTVCLIEKEKIGGVCLNRGCVPAKAWIAAAESMDHAKHMNGVAKTPFDFSLDFARVKERQEKIVSQSTKGLDSLLSKRGVAVIKGEGSFKSPDEITVTSEDREETINFEHAVIATGVRPASLFNLPGRLAMTNETIFELDTLPESILIVGGGYIGCEFASALSRFGVSVAVVELLDRLLPMEDGEVSSTLSREFKKQKITVLTGASIKSMEEGGEGVLAKLADGKEVTAQKALISIGRVFDTSHLGLEKAGVATGERGEVFTDGKMKTSAPKIFAVGDIAGKGALAYTAYREGIFVADMIAGSDGSMGEAVIPNVVFTIPEIGSVGATEEGAGEDIDVGKFQFRALARAHTTGEIAGFVKVIASKNSGRILGVHIIGARATDIIHTATVAISQKMTANDFGAILFGHPTFSEAVIEAVHDVHNLSIHK